MPIPLMRLHTSLLLRGKHTTKPLLNVVPTETDGLFEVPLNPVTLTTTAPEAILMLCIPGKYYI